MIWYKQGKNIGEMYLIYNQRAYIYNMYSSTLKEDVLVPMYMNGAVRVKAISVLQSGIDFCTVGIESDTFEEKVANKSQQDIVRVLMLNKNYISWFTRSFVVNGVSCVQAVFIYNEMTDLNNLLRQVGL